MEEPNHSSVAEGNFLSLFDREFRNSKFARASYGLSQTAKYDARNNGHRKRRGDANPSLHFGKGKRLELHNTACWKIQKLSEASHTCDQTLTVGKGQKLTESVLTGSITIGGHEPEDFEGDFVFEQKVIWSEDPIIGAESGVHDVEKEEERGTVQTKILKLSVGTLENAGITVQGNAVEGYFMETETRVYVKPRGLQIRFIFVVPKGGMFPDDGDYSEAEEGEVGRFFRAEYSTYAKMAHAARLGDKDVSMTGMD